MRLAEVEQLAAVIPPPHPRRSKTAARGRWVSACGEDSLRGLAAGLGPKGTRPAARAGDLSQS